MDLSIDHRLNPFSHVPGTSLLVPGSSFCLKVYPSLIRIYDLDINGLNLREELYLDLEGPLEQFTVSNDLERKRITVSGKTSKGWIRYHLTAGICRTQGLRFFLDRCPTESLILRGHKKHFHVSVKNSIEILGDGSPLTVFTPASLNNLSFGNYKAQDIELIKRRLDLTEIFPLWNKLGQLVPISPCSGETDPQGTFALLKKCRENIETGKPEDARRLWLNLFQAGFEGMFVPRSEDSDYLGLTSRQKASGLSCCPTVLLSEGARLIRQHFIRQSGTRLFILPHLLPELPFGCLEGLVLNDGLGVLSLEWSKKTIRRIVLHAGQDGEVQFIFRQNIRDYRLRISHKDKGERKKKESSLSIYKNQSYFFDNFL